MGLEDAGEDQVVSPGKENKIMRSQASIGRIS